MSIKLSDAIRLGAMIRPQAFGKSFDGVGTCAWGAADEAMGVPVHAEMSLMPNAGCKREEWAWTVRHFVRCPHCQEERRTSSIISVHLNDAHRWTRERIADWVATVEPQDQTDSLEARMQRANFTPVEK